MKAVHEQSLLSCHRCRRLFRGAIDAYLDHLRRKFRKQFNDSLIDQSAICKNCHQQTLHLCISIDSGKVPMKERLSPGDQKKETAGISDLIDHPQDTGRLHLFDIYALSYAMGADIA